MKVVALREAKASLSAYIEKAQQDRVLITKHGRPAALMIGVEGEELEDLLTMGNPRVWELFEARRRSTKTVRLNEVRRVSRKSRGALAEPGHGDPRKHGTLRALICTAGLTAEEFLAAD